jgi:hypothetical protein
MDPFTSQRLLDLRRPLKKQRRFFRERADQSRQWKIKRDGSSGPASERDEFAQ